MGRKNNDIENHKRKTKKNKEKRKKDLYGKYRKTREGDKVIHTLNTKSKSKMRNNMKTKTKKNQQKRKHKSTNLKK